MELLIIVLRMKSKSSLTAAKTSGYPTAQGIPQLAIPASTYLFSEALKHCKGPPESPLQMPTSPLGERVHKLSSMIDGSLYFRTHSSNVITGTSNVCNVIRPIAASTGISFKSQYEKYQ